MALALNLNRQMPSSFGQDNRFNHTSNHICQPHSDHRQRRPNYSSSPCSACSPRNQQPRQCHNHTNYDRYCHACNTNSTLLSPPSSIDFLPDQSQLQSYQHCQCYRCQKQRGEPVMHPLVATPLGIATAGLSGAAFGIYRGITMSMRARKARKAAAESGGVAANTGAYNEAAPGISEVDATATQITELDSSDLGANAATGRMVYLEKGQILGNTAYAVPSPISVRSSSSTGREPVSPISELRSPLSELNGSGAVHPRRRDATIVSEIDGSPVEAAPPSYSEIAGTETGGRIGQPN